MSTPEFYVGPADGEEDFYDSGRRLWRRNVQGNYCRYQDGQPPDGVVFQRDGSWRGLSTTFSETRLVRGTRNHAAAAAELLLQAETDGPSSNLWAPPGTTEWLASRPTRDGRPGYWRKRGGAVLS